MGINEILSVKDSMSNADRPRSAALVGGVFATLPCCDDQPFPVTSCEIHNRSAFKSSNKHRLCRVSSANARVPAPIRHPHCSTAFRILSTAAFMFLALNRPVPLTNVSAPAWAQLAAVTSVIPPSTSKRNERPCS